MLWIKHTINICRLRPTLLLVCLPRASVSRWPASYAPHTSPQIEVAMATAVIVGMSFMGSGWFYLSNKAAIDWNAHMRADGQLCLINARIEYTTKVCRNTAHICIRHEYDSTCVARVQPQGMSMCVCCWHPDSNKKHGTLPKKWWGESIVKRIAIDCTSLLPGILLHSSSSIRTVIPRTLPCEKARIYRYLFPAAHFP